MNNLYLDGNGRDFKDRILAAMEESNQTKLKSMESSSGVMILPTDNQISKYMDKADLTQEQKDFFGSGVVWCRKYARKETLEQQGES